MCTQKLTNREICFAVFVLNQIHSNFNFEELSSLNSCKTFIKKLKYWKLSTKMQNVQCYFWPVYLLKKLSSQEHPNDFILKEGSLEMPGNWHWAFVWSL